MNKIENGAIDKNSIRKVFLIFDKTGAIIIFSKQTKTIAAIIHADLSKYSNNKSMIK
jgi:hypothetical protein